MFVSQELLRCLGGGIPRGGAACMTMDRHDLRLVRAHHTTSGYMMCLPLTRCLPSVELFPLGSFGTHGSQRTGSTRKGYRYIEYHRRTHRHQLHSPFQVHTVRTGGWKLFDGFHTAYDRMKCRHPCNCRLDRLSYPVGMPRTRDSSRIRSDRIEWVGIMCPGPPVAIRRGASNPADRAYTCVLARIR